jgi:type I restriction enzyme, S subunit
MSLPKYPAYLESGVKWLGAVPAHWKVRRLKRACMVFPSNVDKHSRDDETAVLLCNYTDVYYNECIVGGMPFMSATASVEQIARFALRAGDVILTKDSETADDIGISAFVPADLPGVVCGYHLSMVRPGPGISGSFVKRLFDAAYTKARFAVAANGLTRVGLGQYALDNVELPFPPLEEQVAIASFLDRGTAKIDALIGEQEKLIALLAEKRQATISHAVTRGLDPSVPMKNSGVPWLGEVPAHWEVAALKRFWSVTDCKHVTAEFVDEGFPLASIREVQSRYVDLDSAKKTTQHFYEQLTEGGRKPQAGDLIFSRNATVGEVAQVAESHLEFAMGQDVCLLRKRAPGCSTDFLQAVIRSRVVIEQLGNIMIGSTFKRVNVEEIRSLVVAMPPSNEQATIAAFIDRETQKLGRLHNAARGVIALLQERRSALITAAVTGQIDVRGTVLQSAPGEAVAA